VDFCVKLQKPGVSCSDKHCKATSYFAIKLSCNWTCVLQFRFGTDQATQSTWPGEGIKAGLLLQRT